MAMMEAVSGMSRKQAREQRGKRRAIAKQMPKKEQAVTSTSWNRTEDGQSARHSEILARNGSYGQDSISIQSKWSENIFV